MIRVAFCEYILHPNLSPDSVMFVNVGPVASSVDIAGLSWEAESQMYQELVHLCKAEDPERHHNPEP